MTLSEDKNCKVCAEAVIDTPDPEDIQKAVTEKYGKRAFVEVNGIINLALAENVALEIDAQDKKMRVTGSINLQSHEPMEGVPDFNRYIEQVARLPRLSEILLQAGFSPVEWGVNEFRGPGNGMCSVLMSKKITSSTVEDFIRELNLIGESLEKLDS